MDRTRKILAIPMARSNGFDFSNQGLLGIWESFPSSSTALTSPPGLSSPAHRPLALEEPIGLARPRSKRGKHRSEVPAAFNTALLALSAYQGLTIDSEPGWKPRLRTGRLLQRRFALELCGWSVKEDDFDAVITQCDSLSILSPKSAQFLTGGRKMGSVQGRHVGLSLPTNTIRPSTS